MLRGAVLAAAVAATAAACSGGSSSPATAGGDCAIVVHWDGRTYESAGYTLKAAKIDPASVATPAVGESLGTAVEEGCAEGLSTSSPASIEVFAIPGVSPSEAVTTEQRSLLVVKGGTIPPALIRAK